MGSATRGAIAAARAELSAVGSLDLATAEQLLSAGRAIGGSVQFLGLLSDPSAPADQKRAILTAVFGSSLDDASRRLLDAIVAQAWSSEDDLIGGIEEIGIRAAADSAPESVDIEAEIFAFDAAVSSDAQLELALGSKQGGSEAKVALVEALLAKKASAQTLVIITHLVRLPRGRRIGALLRRAASLVADQAGLAIATVTSAAPLPSAQLSRLAKGLAKAYGTQLKLDLVIDPAIVGGLRVQVGDDVIDGTVASRINDLRLQLAG